MDQIVNRLENGFTEEDNKRLIQLRDDAQSEERKKYIITLLVLGNEKIINKIIHKYHTHNESEDLKQEGYFALHSAALSYTSEKEMTFEQYAGQCIKLRIKTYLLTQSRLISIPWFFMKKVKDGMVSSYEKESLLNEPLSLCASKSMEDDSILLKDTIRDDTDIELDYLSKEKKEKLLDSILELDTIEQKVLIHRYGLYNYSTMTLRSISDELGYNINQVYKIEQKAIEKLRKKMLKQ